MNELKPEDVMRALEEWIYNFSGTLNQFCALCNALTLLREKDAEIERLTAYNANLICANTDITNRHKDYVEEAERIARADAITEFADRVCEGRVSNDPVVIVVLCAEREMKEAADAHVE